MGWTKDTAFGGRVALTMVWLAAALAGGTGSTIAGESTKDVVVVNDATHPVPVKVVTGAPPEPWQRQFPLDWATTEGLAEATYTVPAGKRLEIEFVTFAIYLPATGQNTFVRIQVTSGGSTVFHTAAVQSRSDYGVLKQFEATHVVKLYADPGSTVKVAAGRLPFGDDTANGALTMTGHLIPLP